MNDLHSFKNFIFDMDGTVIDSSDAILSALAQALDKANVNYDPEQLTHTLIGPPIQGILANLLPDLSSQQADEVSNKFRACYDYLENDNSTFYPHLYEWLLFLQRERKKLFIATNKPQKPTTRLKEKLDLHMFTDIYTIDRVPGKKLTKLDMIQQIILNYQLDIADTVLVSDTISDIKAASLAGIQSIAVTWGYEKNQNELKAQAGFTLQLDQLKGLTL